MYTLQNSVMMMTQYAGGKRSTPRSLGSCLCKRKLSTSRKNNILRRKNEPELYREIWQKRKMLKNASCRLEMNKNAAREKLS